MRISGHKESTQNCVFSISVNNLGWAWVSRWEPLDCWFYLCRTEVRTPWLYLLQRYGTGYWLFGDGDV